MLSTVGRIAHELRSGKKLSRAQHRDTGAPFRYFYVHDGLDRVRGVFWLVYHDQDICR